MSSLLPWRLGWRGVSRHRGTSFVLICLTALIIGAPFAAGTIAFTATFTAAEVATISMGQADVLARTTSYQEGTRDDAPLQGDAGITRVVEDRDLALVLDGGSGPVAITGRWLSFRNPLATGILTREQSVGDRPEVALSAPARSALGVALGDEVDVVSAGITLTVTDAVAFAPDTSLPLAVIDPSAVTQVERRALLAGTGSPRWLLSTDNLDATLEYLAERGLSATTRAAVPAADERTGFDPMVPVTIVAVLGITVLAAGGTALAGFHRRQGSVLHRLGASTGRTRSIVRVEALIVALAGAVLAAPVGLGMSFLSRAIGQSATQELWGSVEPAWLIYGTSCLLVCVFAPILTIASSSVPARQWKRPRSVRRRRVTPALLGARSARLSARGTTFGAIAVAAIVAVGASSVLIVGLARERYLTAYEADVPAAMVGLGFGRQLTETEVRSLAADTDAAVIEDRRAVFQAAPVVVDSAVTGCMSDPSHDAQYCSGTVGVFEDTVAVIEPAQAAGFLGRQLTPEEEAAMISGDGLLLAQPRESPRLVPMGRYQDRVEYDRPISPVSIPGYAGYQRIPALLISEAAMQRWNLTLDTAPISYYLLTPNNERPTEGVVRAALPPDVSPHADVIMDDEDQAAAAFAAAGKTITAVSSALVFLIVALLVLTWVADSTETLGRLSRLGASGRKLCAVIVARGVRAVLPAALGGVCLTLVLSWVFSRYVNVPVPINGWQWLVPALAAIVALPATAAVRVRFGPEGAS